jgi:signal transduction histidine kinase
MLRPILDRMSIRHELLLLLAGAILVTSVAFGVVSYRNLKGQLLDGIDSKLYTAAILAGQVPPGNDAYYDGLQGPDSISREDYDRLIVAQNNALSDRLDLQYIWSCMLVDDEVHFITSTSPPRPDHEDGRYAVEDHKHARFWEVHTDPHAFDTVFSTMKPDYSSFHNQWGHGRMVLVPATDANGRKYCYGASMSINRVDALLGRNLLQTVLISSVILLGGLGLGMLVAGYFSRPIERITGVAREITRGNLEQDVEIGGSSELRSLSNSIKAMSVSIRDTIAALQKEIKERRQAEEELEQHKGRLEEKVEQRTRRLKQSNSDLEQFAYAASHDLQEPLRKITSFGERLHSRLGDSLDEKSLDYLNRMQNAASRMRGLINDLLSYSRVTTRAEPYANVDLTEVAQNVVNDLEVCIQDLDGRVKVGDLPTIDADRTQMRQLLQNLISNGLKFHREDVAPRVAVEAETFTTDTGEEMCRLTVSDNGIGFDPKYGDKIFHIFQRLHARGKYQGTGVGLATCARIVDRHNGSIRAESSPGEGATFIVELPRQQEQEQD